MENITLDEQGRLVLPKKIRTKLGLHAGEQLSVEEIADGLLLKRSKPAQQVIEQLKGCVQNNAISPLSIKKIWRM